MNAVANITTIFPGARQTPLNMMGKGGSLSVVKLSLLGGFLLLQVYLFCFKSFEVRDYSRCMNEYPLPLSRENKNVSQEFKTSGPLSRIDIMLANYKVKPGGGTLRLSIFEKNKRLYLKNYPANTTEDNRFYSFKIDPGKIPGGNYRLQLDYFPKDKKEKLAVWTYKKDIYPFGGLYVNGKQREGDMTFRTYYLSTLREETRRWLNPSPQFRPGPYILTIGFLLLLFMLNLLFYFFLNKLSDTSNIND